MSQIVFLTDHDFVAPIIYDTLTQRFSSTDTELADAANAMRTFLLAEERAEPVTAPTHAGLPEVAVDASAQGAVALLCLVVQDGDDRVRPFAWSVEGDDEAISDWWAERNVRAWVSRNIEAAC